MSIKKEGSAAVIGFETPLKALFKMLLVNADAPAGNRRLQSSRVVSPPEKNLSPAQENEASTSVSPSKDKHNDSPQVFSIQRLDEESPAIRADRPDTREPTSASWKGEAEARAPVRAPSPAGNQQVGVPAVLGFPTL